MNKSKRKFLALIQEIAAKHNNNLINGSADLLRAGFYLGQRTERANLKKTSTQTVEVQP